MAAFFRRPWKGPKKRIRNAKAADVFRQPPSFIRNSKGEDPYSLRTQQNREHTVCFTGHRMMDKSDRESGCRLPELLEALYQRGYKEFHCGGALGFDQLAAEYVVKLRNRHPDVRLVFCLPCADQCARWRQADCIRYEQLLYLSDETRVLAPRYYDGCMQARNNYMVDRSSICVTYMKRLGGGTLTTVRYALLQDLPVINVAVPSAVDEFIQCF